MEFGEMKGNTSNWSNFCMLLRRAGFTASAGLSCFVNVANFYITYGPSEQFNISALVLPTNTQGMTTTMYYI